MQPEYEVTINHSREISASQFALIQQGTLVFTDLLPTQYVASTSDQVCLDSLPTGMDFTSTKLLSVAMLDQ